MDIQRTIVATFKAMGFPSIVFETARTSREIVLLVDRGGLADHIEIIAAALQDRLNAADAMLTRYDYRLYPRRLRFVSGHRAVDGGTIGVDALAAQYYGARLVFLSSGEALVGSHKQVDRDIMHLFTAFSSVVLLTPTPENRWGNLERNLIRAGCFVAAASSAGVVSVADYLYRNPDESFQRLQDVIPDGDDPLLYRLRRDYYQMSSDIPPDGRQIRRLVYDLATYMGSEDNFGLIGTIAAFPKIDPGISLALGQLLFKGGLTELQLTRVARLPWFRDGRVPDWLRIAMWNHLTDGWRERSRSAMDTMLELAEEIHSGQEWDAVQRHVAILIAEPRRRFINNFFVPAVQPALLSEQLFLNFMRDVRLDPITSAIEPFAPPNIRKAFEGDFDRRTIMIMALFATLAALLFLFEPYLVGVFMQVLGVTWQSVVNVARTTMLVEQGILQGILNVGGLLASITYGLATFAFFHYLAQKASVRSKKAISLWLKSRDSYLFRVVKGVQAITRGGHALDALGAVLGFGVFTGSLLAYAALGGLEVTPGLLSTPAFYGTATYGLFRYLDKRASIAASRAISDWVMSQRDYVRWPVRGLQYFIKSGDRHPLEAIGYIIGALVFILTLAIRLLTG